MHSPSLNILKNEFWINFTKKTKTKESIEFSIASNVPNTYPNFLHQTMVEYKFPMFVDPVVQLLIIIIYYISRKIYGYTNIKRII